ncbi:HAMP domain-containing methyl-accepting chemotaxis protein [Rhizobium sp. NFR03]|uniref:methyl-accepting chemotaxis protein n=1 Tax=Rhizobium sp. NFR03 TaxID=1566263 RepID=UPI0008C13D16|nr:HAMP domain-containing methyl-accepting chemotaxis protein [Rhizobium sp. NFR03]SES28075.1 methyl-accepting chemotaxis protein [Rhizobium sp. NFR03]
MPHPNIKLAMTAIFGVIGLVIVMLSWLTLGGLQSLNSRTIDVADNWLPKTAASGRIQTALNDLRVAYAQHLVEVNIHRMKDSLALAREKEAALRASLSAYDAMISTDRERQIFAAIPPAVADYIQHGSYMLDMSGDGAKDLGGYLFGHGMRDTASIVETATAALVAYDSQGAADSKAESGMTYDSVMSKIFGAALFVGFVLVAAAFYVLRGIARPVEVITQSMTHLAGGDTSVAIPYTSRPDEIGQMAGAVEIFRQAAIANKRLEEEADAARVQGEADRIRLTAEAEAAAQLRLQEATAGLAAGLRRLASGDLSFQLNDAFAPDFDALRHDLNGAVSQLAETLRSVAEATAQIDNGSREISQSSDDLSKRTEQQAASLEETAAALDQITANVSNSSKRADEARSVAVQANASAVQSGKVVANAVDAMQKIEQSANQVSNIIGVIDEIAFQTNLLALNAGVEAARAGDAGKGFAVVAQEVRELAQRSAKAAKEIKELIRNSSVEVQSGVKLVSETGDALRTIEGYVVTINQHMDAIATSAREQSVGLAEVNTAVNQMDQVTQQNAAMVEESNAASAALVSEAERLRDLVGQFQVGHALRQTAAVMAAGSTHRPVASPARKIAGKVARAFSGNAAVKESWEEF